MGRPRARTRRPGVGFRQASHDKPAHQTPTVIQNLEPFAHSGRAVLAGRKIAVIDRKQRGTGNKRHGVIFTTRAWPLAAPNAFIKLFDTF
jgi:hypothetical protein